MLNDKRYLREFLWQHLFRCSDFSLNKWMPVHFIMVTIGVVIMSLTNERIQINIRKIITERKGIFYRKLDLTVIILEMNEEKILNRVSFRKKDYKKSIGN